jgi:hypothetical protein
MPNFLLGFSVSFPQYLHVSAGIEPWNKPQWVFFLRSPEIYLIQRTCVIIRCDVTLPVDTAWLKCAALLSIRPHGDVHINCRGSDKKCRFLLSANTRLHSHSFCSAFAVIVWPSQEGTRLSVHTLRLSCTGITVLCHLCKCGAGGMLCLLGKGIDTKAWVYITVTSVRRSTDPVGMIVAHMTAASHDVIHEAWRMLQWSKSSDFVRHPGHLAADRLRDDTRIKTWLVYFHLATTSQLKRQCFESVVVLIEVVIKLTTVII